MGCNHTGDRNCDEYTIRSQNQSLSHDFPAFYYSNLHIDNQKL